ncbi:MAG TPA: ferrochelatase [Rubricoccaceae bacterium]|nr:ferrochelatase [Rubricoccaceae bacterium]
MTARAFLDHFRLDDFLTGPRAHGEPLLVERGDRVGVVLLNAGGPESERDVARFLYCRYMDPALYPAAMPRRVRSVMSQLLARWKARKVCEAFRQIGGASPQKRHTEEQARALARRLNERFGPLTGAHFYTYAALRYAEPSVADVLGRLQADGITQVALLPLWPHYSAATTGSALAWWETHPEVASLSTTCVPEFAAHPKFVQAVSDRVDEGLQRFPRTVREQVCLVFVAPALANRRRAEQGDPYCCHVHTTVQQVMALRAEDDPGRAFRVASIGTPMPGRALLQPVKEVVEKLAEEGHTKVLLVPVAFVCDRIETAFGLDIALREEAEKLGVEHLEVTSGLNAHPLLIEALAECVAAQLAPAALPQGDGAVDALPAPIPSLPLFQPEQRHVRCPHCACGAEARDWSGQAAVHVPVPLMEGERTSRAA